MTEQLLRRLLETHEVIVGACGESTEVLRERCAAHGITLPGEHLHLLSLVDGASAYGGYFRLFALDHLLAWNEESSWKFAWPARLRDYVCFGETAWGDQYAYKVGDLHRKATPVYFLDALEMVPEAVAAGFEEFLEREFLRNASSPMDEHLARARKRLGDLELGQHIAYVPSPLISGSEDPDTVMKLPAIAAMIVNGDLARQLLDQPQSRRVSGVDTYQDERGRTRLIVRWADES